MERIDISDFDSLYDLFVHLRDELYDMFGDWNVVRVNFTRVAVPLLCLLGKSLERKVVDVLLGIGGEVQMFSFLNSSEKLELDDNDVFVLVLMAGFVEKMMEGGEEDE